MPTTRQRVNLILTDAETEAIRDLRESAGFIAVNDAQLVHALITAGIQKLREDRKAAFGRIAAGGKR
jgi:hypothetical protein